MQMLTINQHRNVVIPPDGLAAALRFALSLLFGFGVMAMEGNKQSLAIRGDPGICALYDRGIPSETVKRLNAKGIPPRRVIEVAINCRS
jgi:hypothetical protein